MVAAAGGSTNSMIFSGSHIPEARRLPPIAGASAAVGAAVPRAMPPTGKAMAVRVVSAAEAVVQAITMAGKKAVRAASAAAVVAAQALRTQAAACSAAAPEAMLTRISTTALKDRAVAEAAARAWEEPFS